MLDKGVLFEGEPWRFDQRVTDTFDNMLERSIPGYQAMRSVVTELLAQEMEVGSTLLDLGSSRGEAIARLLALRPDLYAVGVDNSEPMVAVATQRFADDPKVFIHCRDLAHADPALYLPNRIGGLSIVLTLMFLPIERRPELLARVHQRMRPGAPIVVVEKAIGATSWVDRVLATRYRAFKASQGYSEAEIASKARSLEGVLMPLTIEGTIELLRGAGFRDVECCWRNLQFAALLGRA